MGGNIMILWTTRLEEFKSHIIEYIKDKIDEKGDFYFTFERGMTNWKIDHLDYLVYPDTDIQEVTGLEEFTTDALCEIADKIHLKPVTNEDGSIKTPFQE